MEPFALLKMMGIFVTGGITGRIVLYLLLLAAGVGVRCALQRRRDFRTGAGISAGLWLVCEIIVDIGGFKWMIQTTDYVDEGAEVGLYIEPDAIHIMKKSEYSGMYGDYSSFSNELDELSDAESEPDE